MWTSTEKTGRLRQQPRTTILLIRSVLMFFRINRETRWIELEIEEYD